VNALLCDARNRPRPQPVGLCDEFVGSRGISARNGGRLRTVSHLALVSLRPPFGSWHQYGMKPQRKGSRETWPVSTMKLAKSCIDFVPTLTPLSYSGLAPPS
jgi:hypothetical protein